MRSVVQADGAAEEAAAAQAPHERGRLRARAHVREGGFRRLYRGIGFTLLRSVPAAAIAMPVYDLTREELSRDRGRW